MKFNENQVKAIETVYGNVAVVATAGSGKTAVLTHRIVNMIDNHGIDPGYKKTWRRGLLNSRH